jgi:DNA modification methylase
MGAVIEARKARRPPHGLKPKDLIGIPWRAAFALQADGWYLRSDIIWAKPNPMPESVTDRPTKAHEYLFLLSKSPSYFYDATAVREDDAGTDHTRNVIGPEPSLEPSNGLRPAHGGIRTLNGRNGTGRNRRSVWTVTTQPYPGAHFATFPPKLIEPCILAGSRPDDLVLDPFAGAGTTGVVAARLDRSFVGVELSPDYCELARQRIRDDAPLLNCPSERAA